MTWTQLDDDGRVWGTIVGGDVIRVELARSRTHSGADVEEWLADLDAALEAGRAVQRAVSGRCVKQFSIGAPGFGYDRLGSASDVPVLIVGESQGS